MMTDLGPVQYCMDDTKPDGSHPCIMGFFLPTHALHYMDLSVQERQRKVAEHYAKVFKNDKFRNVSEAQLLMLNSLLRRDIPQFQVADSWGPTP